MPTNARSRLPVQVLDFLEAFVLTGDGQAAAVSVGVHPKRARTFIRETMDHPDAREVFDQIMRTRFAHAGPIALNLLLEAVQDTVGKYTGAVKVEAAKDLLNRSGYTPKAMLAPKDRKDLNEMSRDELHRIVSDGEAELASRAKLIENISVHAPDEAQAFDMEE